MNKLIVPLCVLFLLAACVTRTSRITPGNAAMPISEEEYEATKEHARKAQERRQKEEAAAAGVEIEQGELAFSKWLTAGPLPVPARAFDEKTGAGLAGPILDAEHVSRKAWINAGDEQPWLPGAIMTWFEKAAAEGGVELSVAEGEEGSHVAYVAAYVASTRWHKATFTVTGTRPFALFVNGTEKVRSLAVTTADGDPAEKTAKVNLTRGKHRVLIKTVSPAGAEGAPWRIGASVKTGAGAGTLSFTILPDRTFADMNEAKNLSSVSGLALSPDGKLLAATVTEKWPGKATSSSLRLLEMPEGTETARLDTAGGFGGIKWAPDGKSFVFKRRGNLMRYDLESGDTSTVLLGVKNLDKYVWSPDGEFIYYAVKGERRKPTGNHFKLRGLHDRLTDYQETRTLHVVPAAGGPNHVLTAGGEFAVEDFALSPDGSTIIFLKRFPVTERPFFRNEFWLLDCPSGKERLLRATTFPFENMPARFTWSPDGKRVAFIGPPDQVGEGDRRSKTEHNFFENDLWMIDVATGALTRISDRFDEAVEPPLFWHPDDGHLYFKAHRRTQKRLARIEVDDEGGLEFLHEAPAVVHSASPAAGGDGFAFTASTIDHPAALYHVGCDGGEPRLILDPNVEYMKQVRLGPWERFNFTNDRGQTIEGFLFYPPDFDPKLTYPLVVYYYGGTTPEIENFSTTYYHFIPANGYILYTVNPAGAAGYGESFSDLHVNDWGNLAAADIIAGVEKVLEARSFIDGDNIAGYGGSYGGFMTLSLITQTDLFKASCSLYGISNLASYWGAGIWGYTYGDTAMALSYPWNRPDFYVKQSPLFNADKVQSALLLMHGTDDLNVPSVESEQMFTALKVLGKDVAYVRFPGEGHGIASGRDIYILHRRMMLEWFDKHLKNEPEAWDERWK